MEVKVLEMKREKRRMEAEFEQGKKDYEKKIHDLRNVHVLLEQEVGMPGLQITVGHRTMSD
jgi:hypothetical protein